MATLRTRWLLSILLVILPNSCAPADPPASPSHLECYFPCSEERCSVNIHCAWDPGLVPQIPTNYSLHWEPAISNDGHVTSQMRSGIIHREHFANQGELNVWVEAKNQHGSVKSQKVVLNIADISKPPPPNITLRQQSSIEIEWDSFCDELGFSLGTCYVRNRIEPDQVWLEHEGGLFNMYAIESPQPCTVYEFQVRCACETGLTSDWSTIQRIRNVETNPVGKPDIWWDCGISPARFNCALTWKNLSQECSVLGYEVTLLYNNDTAVSTTDLSGQLCNKMQCHTNTSLTDVSSITVSAFNAHGATEPSTLVLPIPGKGKNEQEINVKMNEVNLTVSWNLLSGHTDNLKEYVVQYKQAGCSPGKGFDWIKVKKNQTTVFFKGQFKKGTPFKVSLFSVSRSLEVHHLSSVVGYSHEGSPSQVKSFKVISITATQVTLFWEPVPLFKQNGVIQYYQIGLRRQNVYNVSASRQHENGTFELKNLSPGQEYVAWIRAVTVAGPGANTTTTFKTEEDNNYVGWIAAVSSVFLVLVIMCILVLLCFCRGANKVCPLMTSCFCEKVPDPSNSHIFRQMKHQINDSLAWICIPVNEPHPNISMLEVVQIQPSAILTSQEKTSDPDELTRPMLGDGCSHMDCKDNQSEDAVTKQADRPNHRYGRQEYSKMVDSDEERDREEDGDDCWSSSEEQLTSGYEKHFMPSATEILEV
ncbi:interleukin 12 receptor, beta 2a, like isoform X2 [Trachinotus anak]|uniref:interleukin 12 receptor, beta 2a, like isoform X2 n=1 Tax=Trachinotus anak TaxID=443729 RepID=UPI0039F17DA0